MGRNGNRLEISKERAGKHPVWRNLISVFTASSTGTPLTLHAETNVARSEAALPTKEDT